MLIRLIVNDIISAHRVDGLGCIVLVIWYGIRQQLFVIGLKTHYFPAIERNFWMDYFELNIINWAQLKLYK